VNRFFQQLVTLFQRVDKKESHSPPRYGKWLLVLATLITSVTIASIIPRTGDSRATRSLLPATPAQTIQLGETSFQTLALREKNHADSIDTPSHPSQRIHWKEVTIRKGDTLSEIVKRAGFDHSEIHQAVMSNTDARVFRQMYPGQKIRLRGNDKGDLQELVYETGPGEAFHLTRQEDRFELSKEHRAFETRLAHVHGTIESSMFEDGQDAGLSDALIMKLVEIFGWDIDFALDLRRGDHFSVIYEEKYWLGQKVADGIILAAEFVNQGHAHRAIAFRDTNGYTNYYTPDGDSVRRDFLRTPVEFSRISSRFTRSRFHPILKTWRAHRGVDYAAPVGTAVRATASGRVLAIGKNGGYGERIVIRHNATYNTLYAHLSRYRAGLHVGSFVDQGQTIGYVGATGLAHGPHLHYEFQVNGVHRNPLTYQFARGGKIDLPSQSEFSRVAQSWSARLDLLHPSAHVASNR